MNESFRKTIKFDETSEKGRKVYAFLDESCGRNKGEIITLALIEFIEKYKLEGKNLKEVKKFLSNYDYIYSATNTNTIGFGMPMPYIAASPTIATESSPSTESTKVDEEAIEKDALNELAALFETH